MRWPRASLAFVLGSRSDPNWAKACYSVNWARSSLMEPASFLMIFVWAEEPTRETEMPTLMAGRTPW